MIKAVSLESKRLLLKPLSLEHLSHSYVTWMNDLDVIKYLETGGDYTLEELEKYLKKQEKSDILFWAIHLKENNKHIGNIKIDPVDQEKNSGEYGVMMGDRTEWGKGYAKEASVKVIEYCFEELMLAKITLGVIESNTSAVKLYQNLGFKVEKVIKEFGVYQNEVCNSLRMVKTNDR